MLSMDQIEEIRQVVKEALTLEFAAIHAGLDRLEKSVERSHNMILAKLDRLAAQTARPSIPTNLDYAAPWQPGVIAGVDPLLMERVLAIEHELASWRKAGS